MFVRFGTERVAKEDRDNFPRDLARFHYASSRVIEELEEASLKVYRAEWMEENLDALLEHEEVKFMKGNEEFEKVIRHKEEIRAALRELGKSNWPTTFVHNDLFAANICRSGVEEGTFLLFRLGCVVWRMS